MHYLFSHVDSGKANEFFEALVDTDLKSGPAFLLRNQLENLRRERGAKSQALIVGLFIKAWEAFRSGAEMRQLRFAPGHDMLPRIIGLRHNALEGLKEGMVGAEGATGPAGPPSQSSSIRVDVKLVTPEHAEQLLSQNDLNRGMAALVVDKYARDMSAGNWLLNGQTIKVGGSGRLLDGQHRLAACLKSGRAFPAIIVRGLEESVFDTFDLGARRGMGDILKSREEQNTSTLAAALRQVWLLEKNLIQSRGAAPTVAELLDVLERHPELRESVRLSHKVKDITAPTIVVTLHYFFSRADRSEADWFLDRLSDGANLEPRNPVLVLRDQLMGRRRERKVSLSDAERAAWIIKAWNAHLQGRSVAHIKWQQLGPRKENFPAIVGLGSSLQDAA